MIPIPLVAAAALIAAQPGAALDRSEAPASRDTLAPNGDGKVLIATGALLTLGVIPAQLGANWLHPAKCVKPGPDVLDAGLACTDMAAKGFGLRILGGALGAAGVTLLAAGTHRRGKADARLDLSRGSRMPSMRERRIAGATVFTISSVGLLATTAGVLVAQSGCQTTSCVEAHRLGRMIGTDVALVGVALGAAVWMHGDGYRRGAQTGVTVAPMIDLRTAGLAFAGRF